MTMSSFWENYDRIIDTAQQTEVGKLMTANGYHVAHTGGGCRVWEKIILDETAYLWICDVGNGLGDKVDEEYLVGLYNQDGEDLDGDTMPSLKVALEWGETRIESAKK